MSLYDADFYEWTREQSAALRRRLSERANTDLDLENLAEEIESLGKSYNQSAESAVARIIEHLLKLQYSPATLPRGSWEKSVLQQRFRLYQLLRDSPSVRGKIDLDYAYLRGRRLAAKGMHRFLEVERRLPVSCPYTLAEIEDEDFWPERKPV